MLSGPFKRQPFFWQLRGEKYDGGGRMDREAALKCVCSAEEKEKI